MVVWSQTNLQKDDEQVHFREIWEAMVLWSAE